MAVANLGLINPKTLHLQAKLYYTNKAARPVFQKQPNYLAARLRPMTWFRSLGTRERNGTRWSRLRANGHVCPHWWRLWPELQASRPPRFMALLSKEMSLERESLPEPLVAESRRGGCAEWGGSPQAHRAWPAAVPQVGGLPRASLPRSRSPEVEGWARGSLQAPREVTLKPTSPESL